MRDGAHLEHGIIYGNKECGYRPGAEPRQGLANSTIVSAPLGRQGFMEDTLLTPLARNFFRRHPAEVAPQLLGKLLVRQLEGEVICGRIVETEAYCSTDPASHSFRGRTERNKAMFGEVGHAYIYFIHGLHYCLNVSARLDTDAGGVLIRALEPLQGVAIMQQLRRRTALRDLASGPAKLSQALAVDKSLYGCDMTQPGPLYLAAEHNTDSTQNQVVSATGRIGVSQATEVLWRFVLSDHYCLSR